MFMPDKGPYLRAAVLCENVIEDKQGVLSLIRVVDRFQHLAVGSDAPAEMPPLPVSVHLVLIFASGEAHGRGEIRLAVQKPDGLSQDLSTVPVLWEGEDRGANINLQLNMVLTIEGLYWIEVRLENELLTRVPLRVVYLRMSSPGTQGVQFG